MQSRNLTALNNEMFLFLCSLEELFLCLNDYETVSCPSICCHSLKLLHITDNNLQDWTEIRKLGVMFPSLDTLVLANNHLNAIEEPDDSLARLFPNLRSISLHKSGEVQAGLILRANWSELMQEMQSKHISFSHSSAFL